MLNRRHFIKNAAGILVGAPMVVKAESLMLMNTSLLTVDDTEFSKIWMRKEPIEIIDDKNSMLDVIYHGQTTSNDFNNRWAYGLAKLRSHK